MDASRGDLIGVLADPYGHEPERPGGMGLAVPTGPAGDGRGPQAAGGSPNAASAAGLVIIAAVAATGVIRRDRDEHDSLTVTMTGQRMRLIDRIEALAADMDPDGRARAAGPAGPEPP